jgi:cytoskeleton protein RodZ
MPDKIDSAGDFGAALRQAREARGITLRQIAATTKISVHALEAIERNDVSKLPGGIFTRAFVRAYAREVGLDPDKTLRAFADRFPGAATEETAESTPSQTASSSAEPGSRSTLGLVGLAGSLFLVIVYFTATSYWSRPRPTSPPAQTPVREAAAAAEPARSDPTPADAPAPAPGSTLAPAPAASTAAAAVAPAALGAVNSLAPGVRPGIRLGIAASGQCWFEAQIDGGRQSFSRLLLASDTLEIVAESQIVVKVGNAGVFTYTINGTPGRSLGAPGAVVNERIGVDNLASFLAR